ncbi:MAG: hypothetical protein ABSH32_25655 [Bryobacteraceae bacterium]|jgi:hypothetical protein
MSLDTELEVWRREWQSETTVPPDLRRRVERQSRWLKIGIAADILVTVVIGGGVIALAAHWPQPDFVVLAVATWIFIAVAWAFGLAVNHGNWSPAAVDAAAFVDLSVRRCRARLASTWFGACLGACEIAFNLAWVYRHSAGHRQPLLAWLLFSSLPMDFVWLFTLVFFGFLFWYRWKKRAELAWLLDLSGEAAGQSRVRHGWKLRRAKRMRKA